jgi:NitT/TauT family transport system permease protein
MTLPNFLIPNARSNKAYLMASWTLIGLVLWQALKPAVFPNPLEIIQAIPTLVSDGLIDDLMVSIWTNVEALLLSVLVGLPFSYLSRVPIISTPAQFVSKLRFLSSSVFFMPFVFLLGGGHSVKVSILAMSQLTYLVTTVSDVVRNIPESRFDDARTLKMSEWLSIWYVVIRGTVAEVLDTVRGNAAMGWAMLMFVEGLIRSEGGVGVLLINFEKHVEWAQLWAVILVILLVGLAQDWLIEQLKKVSCPYAS